MMLDPQIEPIPDDMFEVVMTGVRQSLLVPSCNLWDTPGTFDPIPRISIDASKKYPPISNPNVQSAEIFKLFVAAPHAQFHIGRNVITDNERTGPPGPHTYRGELFIPGSKIESRTPLSQEYSGTGTGRENLFHTRSQSNIFIKA